MGQGRWSDDTFLDSLRSQRDSQADQAVQQASAQMREISTIFKSLHSDDCPLPADTPQPLRDFVDATRELPPGIDGDRLAHGGQLFLQHAPSAAITMLASSLPRGYAAPCLCEILSISQDLQNHPYQRLMGVIQLLVNVSSPGSFGADGKAIVTAQKLRLLHAGVRSLVPQHRPDYAYGVPVNHEDMLATLMGFSYLVIQGISQLGLPLSEGDAEDYYYLWYVYAQMMGIPVEFVPETVAEAAEFYASFARRHDTGPAQNPQGVLLTQHNLNMMRSLIPLSLRLLGFGVAPAIAMAQLMKPEEMALVGVSPIPGHHAIRAALHRMLKLMQGGEDRPFSSRLATLIFQGMIDTSRGGEVTFTIPTSLAGLRSRALV